MSTSNRKATSKKQYVNKISTQLKEEHDQTLKFKNAFWSLKKIRKLYNSSHPVEKGCAYFDEGDLIGSTWSLTNDLIRKL